MGIWKAFKDRLIEKELRELSLDDLLLRANLGADYITAENAMQIPSVAMGVNLIANTVALIPIKLYKEDESNRIVEIDDNRERLLNDDTGDSFTGYELKVAMVRDYLLNGEINIYINKVKNEVKSIHFVNSKNVSIANNADPIFKKYEILVGGNKYRDFEFVRILRNSDDGFKGKGIVEENNKTLSIAYNMALFESKNAKTGGVKRGFLQSEQALKDEYIKYLKDSWRKMYSGNDDVSTIVLNSGVKFQEATETSQEQQLSDRKIIVFNEISKILNIPVNLLEGKFSDDAYLNTMKIAISPILEAIAKGLNKYFLLEKEKKTMFWAFDDKELLKGDTLKRYQAYALALKSGFMMIDEVRYQENLPSLDFNFMKLGLDSVLYSPTTKELYTPNTNQTNVLKEGSKTDKESKENLIKDEE